MRSARVRQQQSPPGTTAPTAGGAMRVASLEKSSGGAAVGRWMALLVAGLLAAAVLAPSVRMSSRLDGLRLELLAWAIAVPYLVAAWALPALRRTAGTPWHRTLDAVRSMRLGILDAAFLALGLATLASTLWAPGVLGEHAGARDLFELIKLALYWVAFRAALLVSAHAAARRLALSAFLAAGSLAAVIALAQYSDARGFAGRAGGWWAEAHHLRGLERDGRAFGTAGNPNYFGALMAMLTVTAAVAASDHSAPRSRARALVYVALALGPLGVVLSGSRGALAMLVVGGGAMWLALGIGHVGARRLVPPALVAGLALIGAVALVQAVPRGRQGYISRVAGAFDPTGDSAIALRLERWRGVTGREDAGDAPTDAAAASLLANGGLERASGGGAAGFRAIPGTEYRLSSDTARSGESGIAYRGNPDVPGRRAAVYQQRALGRRVTEPLAASVWVNLRPGGDGDVQLYTNVFYSDGTREDPHASVAADPARAGAWQRLSVSVTPDPERTVDFVGVYLLSDAFTGEVWADDFALVGAASLHAGDGATATDVSATLRRSPVFGGGPRIGEDSTLDNEYVIVAARFGAVGLAAYLGLWAATALLGLRGARGTNPFGAAVVGIVAGLVLFNLVAGSLYQLQLMAVFWPLAGVLLASGDVSGVRDSASVADT